MGIVLERDRLRWFLRVRCGFFCNLIIEIKCNRIFKIGKKNII